MGARVHHHQQGETVFVIRIQTNGRHPLKAKTAVLAEVLTQRFIESVLDSNLRRAVSRRPLYRLRRVPLPRRLEKIDTHHARISRVAHAPYLLVPTSVS